MTSTPSTSRGEASQRGHKGVDPIRNEYAGGGSTGSEGAVDCQIREIKHTEREVDAHGHYRIDES